ncbi:hypothetical protein [Enterococcus sp. AZ196]|uniref:hypothetical protein n=1 Tax=Enterococcus sp. AZ196 TaxID=2774659 RepID=UPI003D27F7BE
MQLIDIVLIISIIFGGCSLVIYIYKRENWSEKPFKMEDFYLSGTVLRDTILLECREDKALRNKHILTLRVLIKQCNDSDKREEFKDFQRQIFLNDPPDSVSVSKDELRSALAYEKLNRSLLETEVERLHKELRQSRQHS